jgi:hypothetical protein
VLRVFRPLSSNEARALLGLSALLLALATGVAVGANIGGSEGRRPPAASPALLGTALPFRTASGARLALAAVQLVDPAIAPEGEEPSNGYRYVGVTFLIVDTGPSSAVIDVGKDAVLIDDIGQLFSASGTTTAFANCPTDNSLTRLAPHHRVGVCVPFEVPRGDVLDRVVVGSPQSQPVSWSLTPTGS